MDSGRHSQMNSDGRRRVGKTRLVTEGMQRMAGVVSIWDGCLPMRETLPLLPVMDARVS
jgi:hypothetical protein